MNGKVRIMLSLIVVSVFLILAIGSGGNDDESEPIEDIEEVEVDDIEDIKETEFDDANIESLEQFTLAILEDNFEGIAEVEFIKEKETFYLTPLDPGFMAELEDEISGHDYAIGGWESLVESHKQLSHTLSEMLPGYWLTIRNPADPELLLLIIEDGVVLYDFMDDL